MVVQVKICGSKKDGDVMRYNLIVNENGRMWTVRKRYNEFVELDKELEAAGVDQREKLPEKGFMGLRKNLGISSFNEERQEGLELYMECLVERVESLGEMLALEAFLQPAAQPTPRGLFGGSGDSGVPALEDFLQPPAGAAPPPPPTATVPMPDLEDFLTAPAGTYDSVAVAPMGVQVAIFEAADSVGVTQYTLIVNENGMTWMIQKRYSQFLELDKKLQETGWSKRAPLPEKGFGGLAHHLNIGTFNVDRQRGLELYIMILVKQIQALKDMPALAEFLGAL